MDRIVTVDPSRKQGLSGNQSEFWCIVEVMLRAYRFRLYPTGQQKVLLSKHFGCVRWVYNWALAERMARYAEAGVTASAYELSRCLTEMKQLVGTEWLGEVSSQSTGAALAHLDRAYTDFFKGVTAFPRFKSRHSHRDSFENHQYNRVDMAGGLFHTLKFKEGIKCQFSRPLSPGKIKTCTISRMPTGKHFVSILVETDEATPTPPLATESQALGLDMGLKDLLVTSEGERFVNPRHLSRFLRKLARLQRRHARTTKGSRRRDKARHRVAVVHERISNIRKDTLHKLSTKLVRENQATTLCIEDLSVEDMRKRSHGSKSLRRSISDAGWGTFRAMLEYKCRWYGKNLRVIGRYEPSSKTCSKCGSVNHALKLADRDWTCVCGKTHDRDINAAINIRKMAFATHDTYSTPKANTCQGRKTKAIPRGSRKSTPEEQPTVVAENRESLSPAHAG